MCARARKEPEQEKIQPAVPPDNLRLLLEESLRHAEAGDAKRYDRKPNHNLDVQTAAVAKPRSRACPLQGEVLTEARRRAGIVVAAA